MTWENVFLYPLLFQFGQMLRRTNTDESFFSRHFERKTEEVLL